MPPVPPDDELADEVPVSDESPAQPDPEESGAEFESDGGDVPLGEAPEAADPYDPDYSGPTEDLGGELADDAGETASYGFDAASETARFSQRPDLSDDLADSAGSQSDDSDKYKLSDSGTEEAAFAEDAGAQAAAEEPQYASASDESDPGYSSHHPDADEADSGGYTGYSAEEEPAYADAAESTPPPEPEPEPEPEPAIAETPAEDEIHGGYSKPEPEPEPEEAPPKKGAAAASNDPRPGQVRKSAIDEMFARAAELKRRKGS